MKTSLTQKILKFLSKCKGIPAVYIDQDTRECSEGKLTFVDKATIPFSLKITQYKPGTRKIAAEITGNPENIFPILPGGFRFAIRAKDENGGVYYVEMDIPTMKARVDENGKVQLEEVFENN